MAALERALVAKPKGRPKRSERDDGVARIDRTTLNRAKIVASSRRIPLAEYLSDILKPTVVRDYAKVVRDLDRGESGPPKGGPR